MFVSGIELLKEAQLTKSCIPQFNISDLKWAKTILKVCNDLNYPVILGVSEKTIDYMGGYNTIVLLTKGLMMDLNIHIPVVLHLDHGTSVSSCLKAIDSGFSSVMIDASAYELKTNIQMTKEVVAYAHPKGVSVEGELGKIRGQEDSINTKENVYVDIEEAIYYVKETNIDAFAPAIGSEHGIDRPDSYIDVALLEKLNKEIRTPLVLHGASGIEDYKIKELINKGIVKINVNTDLQIAWADQVRDYLVNHPDAFDPRKIIGFGMEAVAFEITNKVNLCKSPNLDKS